MERDHKEGCDGEEKKVKGGEMLVVGGLETFLSYL